MISADKVISGNYVKYLGGNYDLDMMGFMVNHKYLVAGDQYGRPYRYIMAPNGIEVCLVDSLGLFTGKSQYFENADFDEWEKVWRKGIAVKEPETTSCVHEWKEYVGFNDTFTYCVKCDQKR